ncbi:hypothetical protein ABFS82_08G172200 [Erythranthe guttata]
MGAYICCIRNPRPQPNQDSTKVTRRGTKVANIRSLLTAMKTRKQQICPQETNQEMLQVCKNNNTCSIKGLSSTLEDLITSSPGFNMGESNNLLHVPRQSSKRIHPSFDGDCKLSQVEMLMKETRNGESKKSLENRKMKKKVSFRSPEVAEIFVLDSPVMYVVGV